MQDARCRWECYALIVPNWREAEAYYQPLFQMELIGREAERDDGRWYTLPVGKGWEDAEAAGIEVLLLLEVGAQPKQHEKAGAVEEEELVFLPAHSEVITSRGAWLLRVYSFE